MALFVTMPQISPPLKRGPHWRLLLISSSLCVCRPVLPRYRLWRKDNLPTLPPELWFRIISMLPRGQQDAGASNPPSLEGPIQHTTL